MSLPVGSIPAGMDRSSHPSIGHCWSMTSVRRPARIKAPPPEFRDMMRDSVPQEITSLVGREVYTNNGVFIGEVEDLRLDLDAEEVTGLALHQLNAELFTGEEQSARGVIVPYRWVQAVGDVVLVNDIVERIQQEAGDEEEVTA
jgi:sporulation protein YlmC with PRC-barrel domain